MSDRRKALIIGAGIGGLAAAIALKRAGWDTCVYERAAAVRELGFGLALAPNALMALRELGVYESVVKTGAEVGTVDIRRPDGRLLRRFNAPVGVPTVVALRTELYGALLAAVGEGPLRLASRAQSFTQDDAGVTVQFEDGRIQRGDILIGADGLHSTIRRTLHPDEPPPGESGFCALRGVAYGVVAHLGRHSGVAYLGHALEVATIKASSDAVYWYVSLRSQDVTETAPAAILERISQNFALPLRSILRATRAEDMRFDRLLARHPLATWGHKRVTLLGDAAHPVMPHTGQGAAQALEDAVALGLALGQNSDIEAALRRYETVRARRTQRFIAMGPRMARVTTTASPIVQALRSLAIRSIPERWLVTQMKALERDPHTELR